MQVLIEMNEYKALKEKEMILEEKGVGMIINDYYHTGTARYKMELIKCYSKEEVLQLAKNDINKLVLQTTEYANEIYNLKCKISSFKESLLGKMYLFINKKNLL